MLTLCRDNEEDDELTPPHYDGSYLDRESPPVYTDALHDAVLAKGDHVHHSLQHDDFKITVQWRSF